MIHLIKILITLTILLTTLPSLASDILPFIKSFNYYLKDYGVKVGDYRLSSNKIEGYELSLVIVDPYLTSKYEPIQKILVNKDLNSAFIIFKENAINEKLRDKPYIELVSLFSGVFKQELPTYYKNLPLFSKQKTTTFSDNIFIYNDSERSFIIDKDKTIVASAQSLFYNGETFTNYSEDQRKVDLYELREVIKSVYESQEQLTFLPKKMDNLVVAFFSTERADTVDLFKSISAYNDSNIGLLFLPYYDITKEHSGFKDYQLFCQIEFNLTAEYYLLGNHNEQNKFSCGDNNPSIAEDKTQRLISIYQARSNILNRFYLKEDTPYYYLYQQEVFIDYELYKELN